MKHYQGVGTLLLLNCLFISVSATAATGQETANDITARYNRVDKNCGRTTSPAFLCSGVIFRATIPSTQYDSWSPSPAAVTSGATSFSYLRKDAKFDRLVRHENNGYILYPIQGLPAGKSPYKVLCSFPMDGGTLGRPGDGCGNSFSSPANSIPCHQHKPLIGTGAAWVDNYRKYVNGNATAECAFDVSDALNEYAVANFNASIDAMKLMGEESFHKQNELRISSWKTDQSAETLPIQAFFYLPTEWGREDAMFDQQRYFEKTGVWVPVVAMTMPTIQGAEATFKYNEADQAVDSSGKVIDRYIQSTSWIQRPDPGTGKDEWSLVVVLTELGRKAQTTEESNAVFAELVRKEAKNPLWTPPPVLNSRDDSVRRQLVCHFEIARNKPEYNLEPFRPATTAEATKAASCNPLAQ